MKKIIIFITAVTIILVLYLLIENKTSSDDTTSPLSTKSTTSDSQGKEVREFKRPESNLAKTMNEIELTDEELAAKPESSDEMAWRAKVFSHRAKVQMENGDVKFYGKVVDQKNQPIAGAEVSAYSKQYVESIKEQVAAGGGKIDTIHVQVFTDSKGLFSIMGYRARALQFESIVKHGYSAPPNLPEFTYSPLYPNTHISKKSFPVVFKIREKLNPEPLIHTKSQKRLVIDGRSYAFNLKTGELTENKDEENFKIKVRADYDAVEGPMYYPWGVEISVPEGGIILSQDPQSYLAPKTGYEPKLSWAFQAKETNWNDRLKKAFYIKSKDGEFYAYVRLNLITFHTNNATLQMKVFLNPAGSRVLEYDPSLRIK